MSALFPFCSRAAIRGLGVYGPIIPSTHDASSLGQIKRGLEVVYISGLNFACQLISNGGGFKSHDTQASTCLCLGSSGSWLRHPCFEAYRIIVRKLLMRHLIVVLGLTLQVNRCSLARATRPVFFPRQPLFPTAAPAS